MEASQEYQADDATAQKAQHSGKATVITIDTLFERLTLWYWPIATFAFIRGIPSTLNLMLPVFIAPNIRFWCAHNDRQVFSLNANSTVDDPPWNQCYTYNGTECDEFVYDRSVYYGRSIVEEWDLVCNRHWLISTSQSIYLFGNMVGTILFSHIADWFGRRKSIIISLVWSLIGGFAIVFSPNMMAYNVFRFLTAVGTSGYSDGAYTIVVETSSPKQRYLATLTVGIGWSVGMIIMPILAYFIQDWDYLHAVIPLAVIVMVVIWFFLPESPRWQMSSGRYNDARKTLLSLIERQDRFTEKDVDFIVEQTRFRNSVGQLKTKATIADLFAKKYRKSTCVLCILLMIGSMLWYHVTVSTATVGANPYVGFVTGAAFEIPAKAMNVLFIRFARRRVSIVTAFSTIAIAVLIVGLLPDSLAWLKLALLIFCKLWSQVQGAVSRVQMSEIYPTIVRSVAVGFMVTMGAFGQMVAPFLQNIGDAAGNNVPFFILTAVGMLGICLELQLKETFQQELPDVLHKKVKKPQGTDQPYIISS